MEQPPEASRSAWPLPLHDSIDALGAAMDDAAEALPGRELCGYQMLRRISSHGPIMTSTPSTRRLLDVRGSARLERER